MRRQHALIATLLSALVLTACSSNPPQATLRDAETNFEAGRYDLAYVQIEPLAEDGDPNAQYALAYLYYYGYGAPRDPDIARSWMRRAAAQGNESAQQALDLMTEQTLALYNVPREEEFIHISPESKKAAATTGASKTAEEGRYAGHKVIPPEKRINATNMSLPPSASQPEVKPSTQMTTQPSAQSSTPSAGQTPTHSQQAQTTTEMTTPAASPDTTSSQAAPSSSMSAAVAAPTTGSGTTTYGPTTSKETLWSIANQVPRSNQYTVRDVMNGIYKNNPRAFSNNDINKLMKGQTLVIPNFK